MSLYDIRAAYEALTPEEYHAVRRSAHSFLVAIERALGLDEVGSALGADTKVHEALAEGVT